MVTATTTRPEVYFSFFMFTADLRPDDAAYTEVIARHIRELSALGYDGLRPADRADPARPPRRAAELRRPQARARGPAAWASVRITTNVATTRHVRPDLGRP